MLAFPPAPFDVKTLKNVNLRLQASSTSVLRGYYTADRKVTIHGIKKNEKDEVWGMVSPEVDQHGMGLWMILDNINGAFVSIKTPVAAISTAGSWAQEVDSFLRGMGYKGAKP